MYLFEDIHQKLYIYKSSYLHLNFHFKHRKNIEQKSTNFLRIQKKKKKKKANLCFSNWI